MTVSATSGKTAAELLGVTSYETNKSNAAASKASNEMGKQDFLTLFTAQLKSQNPLDPVKNEAFVAQLAQFSQLEAMTNMQTSMESLVAATGGERMMTGAALIGKTIPIATGDARLASGGSVAASIDLPNGASGVKVQVKNTEGKVVQELIAGAQTAGTLDFAWDGLDSTGAAAPAGNYKMTATAVVGGATQNVGVQTLATVRSIVTDPATGDIKLQVDGGTSISLSSVKRISQ